MTDHDFAILTWQLVALGFWVLFSLASDDAREERKLSTRAVRVAEELRKQLDEKEGVTR